IDKHDRDFFFDTAQSRVAREDAFRGASAYVQAESLTQFLFIPELTDHLIEFTEQPTKFICASGTGEAEIDGQISARNCVGCGGCGAQLIDGLCNESAHHKGGKNSERNADYTNENGEPCSVCCR